MPKPKALTVAAFGARGTGKTAWVRQLLARERPKRLLVWDFKHDPGLRDLGTPHRSLPDLVRACAAPSFALRYLPDHGADVHEQFDTFCRAAWLAGNLTLFVDELPEVTKANRAPPAWRRLVNVGREYESGGQVKAVSIIGAGQRPAECDKSFIANCDVVHVGRLGNAADAQEFARAWGINARELIDLPDLHWLEKRADSSAIQRGVLRFYNKRAPAKKGP